MPRFPLDRREHPEPASGRDVLETAFYREYDPFKHGMPLNRPPICDAFAGKEAVFVFDDFEIKYKFNSSTSLSWFLPGVGGGWQDEYYECYESKAKNLFFLFHEKKDNVPPMSRAFAIDLDNRQVTLLKCAVGIEEYTTQDVEITAFFGYIDFGDGAKPPAGRHSYSTEMVRKAVMWRANNWSLIHYYTSKNYFTNQVMIGQDGLIASEPARHIKLRDKVFLFHWVEMTGPGGMGTDIMDFNTYTGVGMFYGVGATIRVCNGFQREGGKLLSHEDLLEFERVFEEQGERAAMAAMGVDVTEETTHLIHV
jgi:hypothetical protein